MKKRDTSEIIKNELKHVYCLVNENYKIPTDYNKIEKVKDNFLVMTLSYLPVVFNENKVILNIVNYALQFFFNKKHDPFLKN